MAEPVDEEVELQINEKVQSDLFKNEATILAIGRSSTLFANQIQIEFVSAHR